MLKSKFVKIILALIMIAGLVAFGGSVLAVDPGGYGLEATAGAAGLSNVAGGATPVEIAGNVIGAALSMIGVLFFILMLYGGILWMTARGNEEQTKKALNAIIAAAIGMVIVLSSYAITNFVLQSVEGGELGAGNGTPEIATCPQGPADGGVIVCYPSAVDTV